MKNEEVFANPGNSFPGTTILAAVPDIGETDPLVAVFESNVMEYE